jgi:hypothetical protein
LWPICESPSAQSNGTGEQQQQQEKQNRGQQLQLALSHIKHLKELTLGNTSVSAGIAEVLAQLTGLTKLSLASIEEDAPWYFGACHNPVVLPSVKDLFLEGKGALQFLAGTRLPLLSDLRFSIQLCKDVQQAQLLQRTRGLLHVCHQVALSGEGKDVPCHELLPMLAALAPAWQHPPASSARVLYLNSLYCPRAVTQRLPLHVQMLGIM